MLKTILIALLVLSTIQQDQTLASSGDNSAVASGDGDSSQFGSPPTPASTSSSFQEKSSNIRTAAYYVVSSPQKPADWVFLNSNSLGGSATWQYPDSTKMIWPRYQVKTYTITFYTDCPQAGVNLAIAGTGSLFITLNGQSILSWGNPWPTIHNLALTKPQLVCGCNTLIVKVYNYYWESPGSIIYTLSQNPCNYNCNNQGVTYYNKDTCSCDCTQSFTCRSNSYWVGYPSCGCKCNPNYAGCPSKKYWDDKTCSCKCQKVCCSKGYVQSLSSCVCVYQWKPIDFNIQDYQLASSAAGVVPIMSSVLSDGGR